MATSPSGEQFEIAFADQRVVVTEVGACLRTYSANGREVLDGYAADEMCSSGRGQVLLPWPNRIAGGSYEFGGVEHQLPLTEPEARNAIHGLVRWASWSAGEMEQDRVVLEHTLPAQPGYPFSLALSIEYRLSAKGLSVRTTATNVGASPCPYGAGAHPYVTLGTASVDSLTLSSPAHVVLGSDGSKEPVDGTAFDFREPRPVGAVQLDNCFTDLERGVDGLACVTVSDAPTGTSTTLWLGASYGYLMLYTGDTRPDVARRSIAVEPMTCPPNAFRSGEGVVVLEPDEEATCEWGITPE